MKLRFNVWSRLGAIPHLFERLFLISWEKNRDCHITMPLSLKTVEVQINPRTYTQTHTPTVLQEGGGAGEDGTQCFETILPLVESL